MPTLIMPTLDFTDELEEKRVFTPPINKIPVPTERLRIVPDFENKTLSAGILIQKQFVKYENFKKLAQAVLDYQVYCASPTRIFNKHLSDQLGLPPKRFFKLWNQLQWHVWIKPVNRFVRKFAFQKRGKLDAGIVNEIHDCLPYLEQFEKDGLNNLLPYAFLKKSTKELKQLCGAANWKKICGFSFSRNLMISKIFKDHFYEDIFNQCHEPTKKTLRCNVPKIIEIPSSILKLHEIRITEVDEYLYCGRELRKIRKLGDKAKNRVVMNIYHDTKRMCRQAETPFNHNWSLRRLEEEHNRLSRQFTLKNTKVISFENINKYLVPEFKAEIDGILFCATLMDSHEKLITEGVEMKHCVGSYASNIAKGSYGVYSLVGTKKKKEFCRSTFGVYPPKRQDQSLIYCKQAQHYAQCNSQPHEKSKEFAAHLLEEINKNFRQMIDQEDCNVISVVGAKILINL